MISNIASALKLSKSEIERIEGQINSVTDENIEAVTRLVISSGYGFYEGVYAGARMAERYYHKKEGTQYAEMRDKVSKLKSDLMTSRNEDTYKSLVIGATLYTIEHKARIYDDEDLADVCQIMTNIINPKGNKHVE
jgi:hypothetical protein